MILVDTSVWISYLKGGNAKLKGLLEEGLVVCHDFIIGELACGNLRNRKELLALLNDLPKSEIAEHREVLRFIEEKGLQGKGLGYIDVHLLASAILTGIPLWTLDNRLKEAAAEIRIQTPDSGR